MKTFKTHILAADSIFYDGECESLIIPTTDGQYGILADHSNVISAIVPGIMTYKVPGKESEIAAVSSGLVKIESNEVLVLVDSAEHPDEIDAKRAKRAADAAKEALLQKQTMREYRSAQVTLARAVTRLRVKSSSKN